MKAPGGIKILPRAKQVLKSKGKEGYSMDKDKLLAAYIKNLANASDPVTYIRRARDFLAHTRGFDKASVSEYIADLPGRCNYKPGTINNIFGVIRRVYAVNGIPWEFNRGEAPPVKQRDEYRPQLAFEIIQGMVEAAKAGRLYPAQQTFLALSTTYGLRQMEMANIRSKDINLHRHSIYIATLKSGRERYHIIPPEIQPYIASYDFDNGYAASSIETFYKKALIGAGYPELAKVKRVGWHAIRRSLVTGLTDNGLDPFKLAAFLRWKSVSRELAMPSRYYGNVVLSSKDSAPMLQEAASDEEIFAKYHPFLSYWR